MSVGPGIVIEGGGENIVLGCTLSRLAQDGVIVNGGRRHGVVDSDLFTLGRGGLDVRGGNRATLEPGAHYIENNHVRDFSRLDRRYAGCLDARRGNTIAHNLFHDAPHHAIRLDGNDHLVQFNEIHSVVYESDDQAGLELCHLGPAQLLFVHRATDLLNQHTPEGNGASGTGGQASGRSG